MLFACSSNEGSVKDALIEQSTVVKDVPSVSSRVVYHHNDLVVLRNGYAIEGKDFERFNPLTDYKLRILSLKDLEGAYSEARKLISKDHIHFEEQVITSFFMNKDNVFISVKDKEYCFNISEDNDLFLELGVGKNIVFYQLGDKLTFYKNNEGAYALEDAEENTPKAKYLSGRKPNDTIPGKASVDFHIGDILGMSNGHIYECPDFEKKEDLNGSEIEIVSVKELVEKYSEARRAIQKRYIRLSWGPINTHEITSLWEDDERVYLRDGNGEYVYKKTDEKYFLIRTFSDYFHYVDFHPLTEKPIFWEK